jgi:hypothetical protein
MSKPASAFQIREVLDEAVRQLSVNAGCIQDRVQASAAVIFDRLQRSDFDSREDRGLFDAIKSADAGAAAEQVPDTAAEEIAADIIDLRDTVTGRAIRIARTSTHADPRGRPRR